MSNEPKAYRFVLATENSSLGGVVYTSKCVYAQDDVDKLIATKDKEITGLRDECAELHNRVATLLSQLRIREERIDELKSEVTKLEVENENRNSCLRQLWSKILRQ